MQNPAPRASRRRSTAFRILGAESTGVSLTVARAVGRQIKGSYERHGQSVELKGMCFIPSSRVDLGDGRFEVLANAVIEVAATDGWPPRSEVVDSVATIDRQTSSQVLTAVKIPALDREKLAG